MKTKIQKDLNKITKNKKTLPLILIPNLAVTPRALKKPKKMTRSKCQKKLKKSLRMPMNNVQRTMNFLS